MIKVEGTLKDIKYSLKNKRIKDNESCLVEVELSLYLVAKVNL